MLADCRHVDLGRASVRVRDMGSGPAIVLTPDCPNVIEHYVELQNRLARSRRVVCFDMPGFGFSHPRRDYDYGIEHGKQIVLELLDALRINDATLAFTCANGFYAMAAAKAAPERVRRLVLGQTPSSSAMRLWAERHVPRVMRVPRLGQACMRVLRLPAVWYWYGLAVPKQHDPAALRATALEALRAGATYRLADMVQGLGNTTEADLAGVTTPTLAIWGEDDRSHPEKPAESLLEHLPHARVIRFAKCGHFPDLEATARYLELLLESTPE
jgi:pimeloyl-ACP methyl ester carboxylesterase